MSGTQLREALHANLTATLAALDDSNALLVTLRSLRKTLDAVETALDPGAFATGDEIEEARDVHGCDEIEIDTPARASRADEGFWVQGWLWLERPADEDHDEEDE